MLTKLISESYWLENSQLDEIYNFVSTIFLSVVLTFFIFCGVLQTFAKKKKILARIGQNDRACRLLCIDVATVPLVGGRNFGAV